MLVFVQYIEFDRVVQESREKAKEAALLIPEIEEHIHEAETATYSALAALSDADNYASAAEQLALAAQNTSSSILVVRITLSFTHSAPNHGYVD